MVALLLGLLLLFGLSTPAAAIVVVDLGHVNLTGTFTIEQDHGTPPTVRLGTFDTPLTVVDVTGIFDGLVPLGATLPAGPLLAPLDWTLGELTLHTNYYQTAGASWAGVSVLAPARQGLIVTGLETFEPIYPGFWVFWQFTAPPYGFDAAGRLPQTGPITFHLQAYRERVPEPATWVLLSAGLVGVGAWRRVRGGRSDAGA